MFVCEWFGYGLVCGFVGGAFTLIVLVLCLRLFWQFDAVFRVFLIVVCLDWFTLCVGGLQLWFWWVLLCVTFIA